MSESELDSMATGPQLSEIPTIRPVITDAAGVRVLEPLF
jgi:hypothetical protein